MEVKVMMCNTLMKYKLVDKIERRGVEEVGELKYLSSNVSWKGEERGLYDGSGGKTKVGWEGEDD